MTGDIVKLPPPDPIFALIPDLKVQRAERAPRLLFTTSVVVADYFGVPHPKVLHDIGHVIADISWWQRRLWFSDRGGFFALTSDPLPLLVRWESKRARAFRAGCFKLVCATAREIEAKTGVNPLHQKMQELFGPLRCFKRVGDEAHECCQDCTQPSPAGPILHDELWATIAQREAFLCFDCIEKRLGRALTQADLTVCAFNAGWISFDGADVAAMQFARGRRLLPVE